MTVSVSSQPPTATQYQSWGWKRCELVLTELAVCATWATSRPAASSSHAPPASTPKTTQSTPRPPPTQQAAGAGVTHDRVSEARVPSPGLAVTELDGLEGRRAAVARRLHQAQHLVLVRRQRLGRRRAAEAHHEAVEPGLEDLEVTPRREVEQRRSGRGTRHLTTVDEQVRDRRWLVTQLRALRPGRRERREAGREPDGEHDAERCADRAGRDEQRGRSRGEVRDGEHWPRTVGARGAAPSLALRDPWAVPARARR